MYFFLFPFGYIFLRDARGWPVLIRDILPTIIICGAVVTPFSLIPGANFFASGGFVDKAANLTASLTGFYIAGLLAVATFAAQSSALDTPIKTGKVFRNRKEFDSKDALTRREYVCSIFGYLSFLSLIISLSSGIVTGLAPGVSSLLNNKSWSVLHVIIDVHKLFSILCKSAYGIVVAHLLICSGYGLYYLIYKIYAKEPRLVK